MADVAHEAESKYLVCVPSGSRPPMDNDIDDQCTHCGRDIVMRPHSPAASERICSDCFGDILTGGNA